MMPPKATAWTDSSSTMHRISEDAAYTVCGQKITKPRSTVTTSEDGLTHVVKVLDRIHVGGTPCSQCARV